MIEIMIEEFPVIAAVSMTVKEITIALDTRTIHATLMEMTLKNSALTMMDRYLRIIRVITTIARTLKILSLNWRGICSSIKFDQIYVN